MTSRYVAAREARWRGAVHVIGALAVLAITWLLIAAGFALAAEPIFARAFRPGPRPWTAELGDVLLPVTFWLVVASALAFALAIGTGARLRYADCGAWAASLIAGAAAAAVTAFTRSPDAATALVVAASAVALGGARLLLQHDPPAA